MSNVSLDRYRACLILSGVGDALGYRNGIWQFNNSGKDIQRELREKFNRIENIRIELPHWRIGDDTLLHLAVAQALAEHAELDPSPELYSRVVRKFKEILPELRNRHPNSNTISAINRLSDIDYSQPYSPVSNDCSSAVRSMCIGLRYSQQSESDKLMRVSIEISRLTHTHVWGYMGGFTSALFVSFAVQQKPISTWSKLLIETLPNVKNFIQNQQRNDLGQTMRSWASFENFWREFSAKQDMNIKDLDQRDEFYRQFSHAGWPGASGTDSVAIAYNALLTCQGSWTELCHRAALHGGHGDATGCIAGAFYGIVYGFEHVSKENYQNLEYNSVLDSVAKKLFQLDQKSPVEKKVKKPEPTSDQRGPCVHFQFVPSNVLDNLPAFRQWRLRNRSTNILSNLVFQNVKIH